MFGGAMGGGKQVHPAAFPGGGKPSGGGSAGFNGNPSQYFDYPKLGPHPNNGYSDPAVGMMFDFGADQESRSNEVAAQLAAALGIPLSQLSPGNFSDAQMTAGNRMAQGMSPLGDAMRSPASQAAKRGSFQDAIRMQAYADWLAQNGG